MKASEDIEDVISFHLMFCSSFLRADNPANVPETDRNPNPPPETSFLLFLSSLFARPVLNCIIHKKIDHSCQIVMG